MLNEKGERALAYITTLDEIQPIEGYDRVEHGRVGGWKCIINKADNMKVGDKVVYFEVDSKVPSNDDRFSFLEKRHFKIKSIKMCGTISQGLIMPINLFPEIRDKEIGTDVTDILKITHIEEDNNKSKLNPNAKYDSMRSRHKKLFKKRWVKWLMKRQWGKDLLFMFFGKKKDKPKGFPSFISKTDEERIENVPWRLEENKKWVVTEKLDGTSCTYALQRKGKNKFEFYVCSRNVRQKDETQSCYHDHNIYWDLAFKYDIENKLKLILNVNPEMEWVAIQGEGVGSVQGNPLKLKEDDLYVFNYITSTQGRYNSYAGRTIIEAWNMKWVPIIGIESLPNNLDEFKLQADGPSTLNPDVLREGYVYRSMDGKESFKNISNKYLLSKH